MPRIDANPDELVGTDAETALLDDFASGFKQSKRGNWWRTWDGLNLTIFRNRYGRWQYCIADSDGPHWSRNAYDSEGEAMESLYYKLVSGEAE